jgi:ABC-2 type transport system ATP-binding protein
MLPAMPAAIELTGVTKTYDATVAVDDLSLAVPEGSIYGFIGPNGSGKTTTIRMVMNILLPDRGDIVVLGERSTRAARDRVGYLPEERSLYKRMTVNRVLEYFGRLKGGEPARLRQNIRAWLERLGLAAWADHRVDALSKGMAQKVQFIAAAVAEPALVILDEPFSGLDPVNAEALKDAVLDLRKRGTTIVFSTHDMRVAERLCDRIFMIFKGKKVLDGTLDEIQARYGHDTLLVRSPGGRAAIEGLPGVDTVNDQGNEQEVRLAAGGDPQAFLRALLERTAVHKFEVVRPSLHDIFVRIAKPSAEEVHA